MFRSTNTLSLETLQGDELEPFIPSVEYNEQLPSFFNTYNEYSLNEMRQLSEVQDLLSLKVTGVNTFAKSQLSLLFPDKDLTSFEYKLLQTIAKGIIQTKLNNRALNNDLVQTILLRSFLALIDISKLPASENIIGNKDSMVKFLGDYLQANLKGEIGLDFLRGLT